MMDAKRGETKDEVCFKLLISIHRVALSLVTVSGNNDNLISNSNHDINMYINYYMYMHKYIHGTRNSIVII